MFRRACLVIVLAVMGTVFFQGAFYEFHQGTHVAREMSPDYGKTSRLNGPVCQFCAALHQQTETPSFGFFLSVPLPASVRTELAPVLDPKSEIARTCCARAPPAAA